MNVDSIIPFRKHLGTEIPTQFTYYKCYRTMRDYENASKKPNVINAKILSNSKDA